ncbi:MAG: FecR domain-containing protein [Bacteroidota bacterium]
MPSDVPPPRLPLDDLRAALADTPAPDREALERVWHALGEVAPDAPAPDTDAAWETLRSRLGAEPSVRPPAADRPAADRPAAGQRRARPAWPVAVVSTLTLAAIVATVVVWQGRPLRLEAAPGATEAAVLADGSLVRLNSGAALVVGRELVQDGVRTVRLEGEAFFDVASGTQPFVVETHDATVEVLGTGFNVRAYAGEGTAVTLEHGRVRVESAGAEVVLEPGETVRVEGGALGAAAEADVARATAWQRGGLVFEAVPLAAVFAEVERRYAVRLDAGADVSLDTEVTAFYADRPALDALLGDLGAAAGVRFAPTAGGYDVRPAP